jgi:hypothetical protein
MRLYIFRSEASAGLRAFVGDAAGRKLPDQLASDWRSSARGRSSL